MFGRRNKDAAQTPADSAEETSTTLGKGHATPTRREAEEARKQQLRIPKDPKDAKRAARERDRAAREQQRQGMLAGDERYMPARDRGPAKAFTRDFVDARYTFAEYFVFVAIAVLALGFIKNQSLQMWISLAFFVFTALIAIDIIIVLVQLNIAARKQFPNPADRRGITLYAGLRVLQLRRLRLPPARVRRGGRPKD